MTDAPATAGAFVDDDAPPLTDDDAPPPFDDPGPLSDRGAREHGRSGPGPSTDGSAVRPPTTPSRPANAPAGREAAVAARDDAPEPARERSLARSSADEQADAHPFDTAPAAASAAAPAREQDAAPAPESAATPASPSAPASTAARDEDTGPSGDVALVDPTAANVGQHAVPADAAAPAAAAGERPVAGENDPASEAGASAGEAGASEAETGATREASPLEPVAPTPPVTPVGPLELAHVRDAWPEVLGQLEVASRASWLIVSTATVRAYDAEVLTLSFRTSGDLGAFKTRTADGGPSEDLRRAIETVLGVRVKYLARLEGDGPGGAGPGAPSRGPSSAPSAGSAPDPGTPAHGSSASRSSAPYTASVTEWAVAPIPSADVAAPPLTSPAAPSASSPVPVRAGALAVDDEPDDAASTADTFAVRTGVVLPPRDVTASVPAPDEVDDDDVIPPADDVEAPLPPVVVPRMAPLGGGVQRYGEAVVRQMLGAAYVRDEPYEPPTRFT